MEKLRRSSGVLLHVSSLPNKYSLGTFSCEALRFLDYLKDAGFAVWQTLPITDCGYAKSPYSAKSTFAINPTLIDLSEFLSESELQRLGLSKNLDIETEEKKIFAGLNFIYEKYVCGRSLQSEDISFQGLDLKNTEPLSDELAGKAKATFDWAKNKADFEKKNAVWLDDYALYKVIKTEFGEVSWVNFPESFKNRDEKTLAKFKDSHAKEIDRVKFIQFVAFIQWQRIKTYAQSLGIELFGDVPYYVEMDSADVWSNPKNWKLTGSKTEVAGVPPDYFNAEGQRWGNPIYDFENQKKDGYKFWVDRFKRASELFDIVRIDHFIAFARFWAIPSESKTAVSGKWVKGFGDEVLKAITKEVKVKIVAEDLGIVTDEVTSLREKYNIPGLKVVQFAFDSNEDNVYKPHNFEKNCVAYIGTHDNDTFMGLLNHSDWDKINRFKKYLRIPLEWGNDAVVDRMIETLYRSSADMIIFTTQDILKQDSDCRMNTPGTTEKNWMYQLDNIDMLKGNSSAFRELSETYGRYNFSFSKDTEKQKENSSDTKN